MPAPASLPTLMQATGLHIDYAPPLVLGVPLLSTGLTSKLSSYRHTTLAVGGFWTADITIEANDADIEDWFEYGLGRHIETLNFSQQMVWSGFVNKISIAYGGLSAVIGPLFDIVN